MDTHHDVHGMRRFECRPHAVRLTRPPFRPLSLRTASSRPSATAELIVLVPLASLRQRELRVPFARTSNHEWILTQLKRFANELRRY